MTAKHSGAQLSSRDPSPLKDYSPIPSSSALELMYPERLVAPTAWVAHIPFAFWIADALRPKTLVELGVHSGNSYCAFLQSVRTLSLPARCFGIDHWQGDEHAGVYGREVYDELKTYHDPLYGAFSTLIKSTFQEALAYFSDRSIDLLHIDGLHTCESIREDFTSWLPKLSSRSVVLFHDTNVREQNFGVWKFWQDIAKQYPHFEFIHGHGLGIAYTGENPPPDGIETLFRNQSDVSVARIRSYFARLGESLVDRFSLSESKGNLIQSKKELHAVKNQMQVTTENMNKQLVELNKRAAILEGELQAARKKLELFETENAKLKASNTATRAQLAEIEPLHRHIVHIEAKLKSAELARERIQLRSEAELAAALVEKAETATQISDLEQHLTSLQEKLAEAELQRDSSARLLRQQTAIISRLQRERSVLQNGGMQGFSHGIIARTPRIIKRLVPKRVKRYIKSKITDSLNAE